MLVGSLAFVVASLLVVVSAAAVVARLRLAGPIDRLVAFGTLAVTQIELSLLISGGVDSLRRPTLCAVNVVITAAALAFGHRELRSTLRRRPRLPALRPLARRSPWTTILVCLAAAELAWRLFLAAVLPPFAWDALSYHLTTTAEWIQRGKLVTNPLSLCCAHYPLNTELTFVWPGLLLGNDTLVDAVQIGFAVLGALAVAGIGRVAGLSRSGAVAGGAIFFLTPVILAQSNTNYNDVAFTGMFLCGLFFVVRYALSGLPRLAYLGLAGLATGFALGSKGTGVVYAAVLVVVVVGAAAVLRWRAAVGSAAAVAAVLVFVAGLVATGGFWYGRNLVDHGNPVYPFDLRVAGVDVFSGPLHVSEILSNPSPYHGESNVVRVLHSWLHDATPTRSGSGFYEYEERVGGFGIIWPWLALPALAVFIVFAARRRRELLLTLIGPVALIFLLQPYEWWSRFTMVLPAIGAVAVVHLVERVPGKTRAALQLASAAFVFFGAALATGRVDPAGHGRELSAFHIVRLAFEPGRDRTLGKLFHPEYAWLDSISQHARIDIELGYEPRFVYPAFGPRFSRPVRALRDADDRAFVDQLADDRARYVFVGRGRRFDRMASHDPNLTLVYRDHRVSAYRVEQPPADASAATSHQGGG